MFNFGRREGYRLEVVKGIFRTKRGDVAGSWRKITRKFIIRNVHQTLKSNSLLYEVNFAGMRCIGNGKEILGRENSGN